MRQACFLFATFVLCFAWIAQANEPGTTALFDARSSEAVAIETEGEGTSVELKDGVLRLKVPGGGTAAYPGVRIKPRQPWDASAHGRVFVDMTNEGTGRIRASLRIDNAGDWRAKPWSTEVVGINPGETKRINIYFGYSFGKPAFALDPAKIVSAMIFIGKSDAEQVLTIREIRAGGVPGDAPPVDPATIRIPPRSDGVFIGDGIVFDVAQQADTRGGSTVTQEDGKLKLAFTGGPGSHITLKPLQGRWNLNSGNEIRLMLRNTGVTPATPVVELLSNNGPAPAVSADTPLAPGEQREMRVSFIPAVPWQGGAVVEGSKQQPALPGTGTRYGSDNTSGVRISVAQSTPATLELAQVRAAVGTASVPEWLGHRPPVAGDWAMTFNENFDATEINLDIWSPYTQNFWDRRSHFSKRNVVFGDGQVRLRYEKRRGSHNDDPDAILFHTKENQSDYAVGFLDTYGRWVQRYGYWEARVKLPTAPGLWPAFWLMPDRGEAEGPQWKRADTGRGAMEFDIMEHLTKWGPYRYNIAMHFDGYGQNHKAMGTDRVYSEPDSEGYLTTGMLWLPGELVFYANGREIGRWENPRISSVQSYIKLYMVSGGWDNLPLDDGKLPDDFIIDYVRIWQRRDLASEVDSPAYESR
jgi:beta-glucanase (GH16 family)